MTRTNLGDIPATLAAHLARLQDAAPDESEAFVYVATFCEIALRALREARPSAVRDYSRTAELALRLPDGPAGVLLGALKGVRVEIRGDA